MKLALRGTRRLRRMQLRVQAHPSVCRRLESEDRNVLKELEERFRGSVAIEPRPEFHIETVRLINERTGKALNE